ncbi:hypothetical protein FLONG3_6983 [Fusarium longipes]|uniref:Uncharacterized protein n=1 Tax=Fusarium longipes TaxID=694270 RepID=A0A395SHE9_9HYPO|nr:hypothetical protein FLONG3_6983 [Fusarium longipes]
MVSIKEAQQSESPYRATPKRSQYKQSGYEKHALTVSSYIMSSIATAGGLTSGCPKGYLKGPKLSYNDILRAVKDCKDTEKLARLRAEAIDLEITWDLYNVMPIELPAFGCEIRALYDRDKTSRGKLEREIESLRHLEKKLAEGSDFLDHEETAFLEAFAEGDLN